MDVNIVEGKIRIGTDIFLEDDLLQNILFENESPKRGNSGIVFLGIDKFLKRKVAVKVWCKRNPKDKRSKDKQGLFEAKKGAQLNSKYFAHFYSANKVHGYFYAIQEYVDGQTLKEWLSEKQELEKRGKVWQQIFDGIIVAHEKRIYHGDLHSNNIMIQPNEDIKIIDMGTSHFACSRLKSRKREGKLIEMTMFEIFPEYKISYSKIMLDKLDLNPEKVLAGMNSFVKLSQSLEILKKGEVDEHSFKSQLLYIVMYATINPTFKFDELKSLLTDIINNGCDEKKQEYIYFLFSSWNNFCANELGLEQNQFDIKEPEKSAFEMYEKLQNKYLVENNLGCDNN